MTKTALAQAIESMETVRKQVDPFGALREWRLKIAQQIIRPAGKARRS